jgi:hypothetical protein
MAQLQQWQWILTHLTLEQFEAFVLPQSHTRDLKLSCFRNQKMEKTSQKNIKTERFVLSMAQSDLVAQDSRSASTRNPQPVGREYCHPAMLISLTT